MKIWLRIVFELLTEIDKDVWFYKVLLNLTATTGTPTKLGNVGKILLLH